MFPSEAEDAIRDLHSEGKVKAFWYKGAILVKLLDLDPNDLAHKIHGVSTCECEACVARREKEEEKKQPQEEETKDPGMYA